MGGGENFLTWNTTASRSLSHSLHLKGIAEEDQLECDENEDGHRCRHCWNIVTSFPLDLVLKKIPEYYGFNLCLNYSERIEALAARHDNPFRFKPQAAIECFLAITKEMFSTGRVFSGGDIENSFIERMKSQGGEIDEVDVGFRVEFYYISVEDMKALEKCFTDIVPSVMSSVLKRELLSAVPLCGATKNGKKRVLVRQTFESFVELGFDLSSKDFVLMDPLKETALETFSDHFRFEEAAS